MRTKSFFLTIPSLALAVALTACTGKSKATDATSNTAAPADLSITTLFSPNPPRQGNETITIVLKDANGDPVKDATVSIATKTPAQNGPTLTPMNQGDGTYVAHANLNEAAVWTFDINATVGDGTSAQIQLKADIK